MSALSTLLRMLLRSITVTLAPLAVLISVNAALLAGQTGNLLAAGAAGVDATTELDDEYDVPAQFALWWQEQHDAEKALESADLEAAFAVLVETPEFRSQYVAAAEEVGDAWNSGETGVWTIDFSSAVQASRSRLEPDAARQIIEQPVLQSDPWLNPGADKLPAISIVAALLAIGLCLAAVLISRNVRTLARSLWPLAIYSVVQLFMLSRAANSSDAVGAALGVWLQDRLQIATLATLLVGAGMAMLMIRTRPLFR